MGFARSELERVLPDSAAAAGAELRTATSVVALQDGASGATATLSDGSTRQVDLVVVADGVASRTRRLLGIDVAPTYSGQMVWRALVPRPTWADRLFTFSGHSDNAG